MSITMINIEGKKQRIRFYVYKDKKRYRIKKNERGIILDWLKKCIQKYGVKVEPQLIERESGFSILFCSDNSM